MARPAKVSPDRILAAAAAEFAARGFAGARVDRIARRARVNKAMLYYHFGSKQELYRALLRGVFAQGGARLSAIAAESAPSVDKIDRTIAAMAEFMDQHAYVPAIMLREIAEGGSRLDRVTLEALATLPRAVAAIVAEGVAAGHFRPVQPVLAYFVMLAPIVFYLAGAPIRKELSDLHLGDLTGLPPDRFVRDLQSMVRRALARDETPSARIR